MEIQLLPEPKRGIAWRYRLLLCTLAMPFMGLGLATLLAQRDAAPRPLRLAGVMRQAELLGLDSRGNVYIQSHQSSVRGLRALDRTGRELWRIDTSEIVGSDNSPLVDRLQEQADGTLVFRIENGPLFAVDAAGRVVWRFNPYRDLPLADNPSPLPAVDVPPFTIWHDGIETLYALDYAGALLWSTEAWQEGPNGDYYGLRDSFADGELLVTVRRPATRLEGGTGDYNLRSIQRNGASEELWRLDLHGTHGPPVRCGEMVLSYEEAGGKGLCRFENGHETGSFGLLQPAAWGVHAGQLELLDINGRLAAYSTQGSLVWDWYPGLSNSRMAPGQDGSTYIVGNLDRRNRLLRAWPQLNAWTGMIDSRLKLGGGVLQAELNCCGPDGRLRWSSRLNCAQPVNRIFCTGQRLALDAGADLLLYDIPAVSAADAS